MALHLSDFLNSSLGPAGAAHLDDRLEELAGFGSDPGALRARTYVPPDLPAGAPLVVVLHGCTQTAAGYDHGSGWSRLADIGRFALLFPEQRRENNPNLCFNWFVPDDIRRDGGEVASIRQMVGAMLERHGLDGARVYVTGLSAGGAMAAAALAAYPEVFAGGAVIAGLPYGCAANVPQALKRMRGEGLPDARQLAERLRGASGHRGRWPTLSVWHGTADATVHPANAEALLAQWRAVHGAGERPDLAESDGGVSHRVWRDAAGRVAVESHMVAGMGHGTPLKTAGPEACGAAAPFMLEVGVSSTCRIARDWGLVAPSVRVEADAASRRPDDAAPRPDRPTPASPWRAKPEDGRDRTAAPDAAVGDVIENALRKAGLLR